MSNAAKKTKNHDNVNRNKTVKINANYCNSCNIMKIKIVHTYFIYFNLNKTLYNIQYMYFLVEFICKQQTT